MQTRKQIRNRKPPEDTKQIRSDRDIIRLNRIIAESGLASRRKADELIEQGMVKVNGKTVNELGTKARKTDLITVNGDPLKHIDHFTYILLNKPKNTISTTSDEKGRKTVLDIIKTRSKVYPVGRLDRNTTGVLLFTNDGDLTNNLIHPKNQIERVYNVTLDKAIRLEDAKRIASGVELEDGRTAPCEVFVHPDDKFKVTINLTEGKNREVRRIFEVLGYEVKKLDRKYFANLTVKGLSRGEYRHLTKDEVMELKKLIKH